MWKVFLSQGYKMRKEFDRLKNRRVEDFKGTDFAWNENHPADNRVGF